MGPKLLTWKWWLRKAVKEGDKIHVEALGVSGSSIIIHMDGKKHVEQRSVRGHGNARIRWEGPRTIENTMVQLTLLIQMPPAPVQRCDIRHDQPDKDHIVLY